MQNNKGRRPGAGFILSASFTDLSNHPLCTKHFLDDRAKIFLRYLIKKHYKNNSVHPSHPPDDFLWVMKQIITKQKLSNKKASMVRLHLSSNPHEIEKLKSNFVQCNDWKTRLYEIIKIKYIGEVEAEENVAAELLDRIFSYIEKPSKLNTKSPQAGESVTEKNMNVDAVSNFEGKQEEIEDCKESSSDHMQNDSLEGKEQTSDESFDESIYLWFSNYKLVLGSEELSRNNHE